MIKRIFTTFFYNVKRYGLINAFRMKRAFPDKDQAYIFAYEHYYSKLKAEDYEKELKKWYEFKTKRRGEYVLNPVTYNDKIQWLKLYDSTETKTVCADKVTAKNYVANLIGEEYIIPTIGVWKNPEEIDYSSLPNKVVFKSNTGSRRVIVIDNLKDEDKDYLSKIFQTWNSVPFGFNGMELHYLNIDRKIMAEQYIEEIDGNLHDYKFHCFRGKPLLVEVIGDRDLSTHSLYESWFDMNWKILNISEDIENYYNYDSSFEKPKQFSNMMEIAALLSQSFEYVRVDLYLIGDKIYFGELTFTPANGLDSWKEPQVKELLGKLIRLPGETSLTDEEIDNIMRSIGYRA